jgi:hypothetical protein
MTSENIHFLPESCVQPECPDEVLMGNAPFVDYRGYFFRQLGIEPSNPNFTNQLAQINLPRKAQVTAHLLAIETTGNDPSLIEPTTRMYPATDAGFESICKRVKYLFDHNGHKPNIWISTAYTKENYLNALGQGQNTSPLLKDFSYVKFMNEILPRMLVIGEQYKGTFFKIIEQDSKNRLFLAGLGLNRGSFNPIISPLGGSVTFEIFHGSSQRAASKEAPYRIVYYPYPEPTFWGPSEEDLWELPLLVLYNSQSILDKIRQLFENLDQPNCVMELMVEKGNSTNEPPKIKFVTDVDFENIHPNHPEVKKIYCNLPSAPLRHITKEVILSAKILCLDNLPIMINLMNIDHFDPNNYLPTSKRRPRWQRDILTYNQYQRKKWYQRRPTGAEALKNFMNIYTLH